MLKWSGRIIMKKLFIILVCSFTLVGCSNQNNKSNELINYVEAKEQIINYGAVLIDVRTEEEYNAGHIDGAILLSLDLLDESSVSEIVMTKGTPIIVYCASGNRSHQAVEKLTDLGYTKVYDLGSMSNWEE